MKDYPEQLKQKKGQRVKKKSHREFYEDGYDQDYVGDEEDEKYLNSLNQLQRETVIAQRHRARDEFERKKRMRAYLVNEKPKGDVTRDGNLKKVGSRFY